MCNLSQGIYDDGLAKGFEKGRAEGKAEGKAEGRAEGRVEGRVESAIANSVKVVKNLLAKGFTLDEALAVADIDRETYEKNCSDE